MYREGIMNVGRKNIKVVMEGDATAYLGNILDVIM